LEGIMKKLNFLIITLFAAASLGFSTSTFSKHEQNKKTVKRVIIKLEKKHRDFNESHRGPHERKRL
jgi:hypothetical protein